MMMASCSVTVAVEKATSELLLSPDWTLNISICDSVNSHHSQGKDAIKAVKRRLQHKNAKVQLLALTLLEAMVKNCGEHLHSQIAEKHLLSEMVKIVRKKGDFEVRNKILMLLETWHEAFGGVACRYPHYNLAYDELRRSGVRFPERSQEPTLMLRAPNARPSLTQSSSGHLLSSGSFRRLDETMATEIESLSLSSLESMRNVMDLVNEMVQAINTADSSALKDELIVDLVDRCRSNQKKLIQMLTTTADEEVLARGLELNDSMQGVLARHDAIASGVSLPPSQAATSEPKRTNTAKRSQETSPGTKGASAPEYVASSSSNETESDEEEEEDEFAQLAKRHMRICAKEGEEEALFLLDKNENGTTETQAATECKDLALSKQVVPASTTKAEQDIIELLSLTLSTTAFSPTQKSLDQQTQSSTEEVHNSYVVPWAQCQAEGGVQLKQKVQFERVASQLQPQLQYTNPPQEFYSQSQVQGGGGHFRSATQSHISYGYPPPPWANADNEAMWEGASVLDTRLHYCNSFPARGSTTETAAEKSQARKPYVPPYRLFEDLNVFRSADGDVQSTK